MAKTHTVKQGEHLTSIAKKFGFRSYLPIWDHTGNAELKKKRVNPNVLYPGDRLQIPDREVKKEARATGSRHRFQLTAPSLLLRLAVEDAFGNPAANIDCELKVENSTYRLRTDGRGRVEQPVPFDAENGEIVIKDPSSPLKDRVLKIRIGHLDPVEEFSGQVARLNNLGYFAGPAASPDDRRFRSAVEEFQCDQGLTVDGKCGPLTQARLKKVHGS